MKKLVTVLAVSLLFLTTAKVSADETGCCSTKWTQESGCYLMNCECTQQFLNGLAAGAAAGMSVELLRKYILPDITSWNLYGNFGICRDQLTGEAKVATAALGLAAFNNIDFRTVKKAGSQLLGIIVGACAASYATKLLTKATAPAASVQAQ